VGEPRGGLRVRAGHRRVPAVQARAVST
jgi:hypothetical protein